MKINVGVMGANAEGSPDVIRFEIECTQEQYHDGEHYEIAKKLASEQGFDIGLSAVAFDERDPAWKAMNSPMETFYRNLMDVLKRAYEPGGDVDGGDFVADVTQFCDEQVVCLPDDFLVGVIWCDDSFVNEFSVAVDDFTVVFDQQVLDQISQEAGVTVALVSPNLLFNPSLPDSQDLLGAARCVVDRGETTSDNAATAMRSELAEKGFVAFPESMDTILCAVVVSEVERRSQVSRERSSE